MSLKRVDGTDVEYERLNNDSDLSSGSVAEALRALGLDPDEERTPVLVTSGREFSWASGTWADWQHAVALALRYGLRVRIDPAMTDADEWYIEWQGRRVGSPGC